MTFPADMHRGFALRSYLAASHLMPLFAKPVLRRRLKRGKEHATRWPEKLGQHLAPRPDGPLICVGRVQPTYPPIATQRGLEGWVDVRFDVMTNGLTANIEIVRSSNRIFEKSARRAAERFRFKAPVVNGVPLVSTGIEYRFRFDMEE